MTAAITCTPSAPISKVSACNFAVTGVTELTGTATYYIKTALAGQDSGKSYPFDVAAGGTGAFVNYIFPAAGTWTVTINKTSDDTTIATVSPVVS